MGSAAVIAALLVGLTSTPELKRGIALYEAEDYPAALSALTGALTAPGSDRARIHVYIGLIQFRFDQRADAKTSFRQALEYDEEIQLPKGSPPGARRLFRSIQKSDAPKRGKNGKKKRPPPEPPPRVEPPRVEPPRVEPPREDPPAIEEPPVAPPPPSVAPPPPPPPAITTVDAPPPLETSPGEIAGWALTGVGAAGVVTAVVFGILSDRHGRAAHRELVGADAKALHDRAVTERTVALISGGVGAAAVGVGVALLLSD